MSSKVDQLPFPLGKTYYAHMGAAQLTVDVAAVLAGTGVLKGEEMLGQIWEIKDTNISATSSMKPIRTNVNRKIMAVRNVSGATLHRKRLVTLSIVAGAVMTKEVVGYNTDVNMAGAYPVDEHLGAAGVPDDDIFWVVIEGPALCTMPASQVADIAAGDFMGALTGSTTAATTSGRVYKVDATATNLSMNAMVNYIGQAMSAISSSIVAGDILVNVRRHH